MDDSLLLHLSENGFITSIPARNAWERLSAYESSDLVRRLLKERHGLLPKAGKAMEVAAHVTQGRQYFDAARGAAVLVRPLLLYYGVLSLSRAVILCADVNRRESTLAQSHGLVCPSWGEELATGLSKLPEQKIVIRQGSFTELAESTKNVERSLVHGDNLLRTPLIQEGTTAFDVEGDASTISLKDALGRVPDLIDRFQVSFGELAACHPACIRVHGIRQTDYYVLPTRSGLPNRDALREALGLHRDIPIDEQDNHYPIGDVPGLFFSINRENSPPATREFAPQIKNDSRAIPYIVEPFSGDVRLSTLSLLFLLSYAMGMLVRYHPSRWAQLAGQGDGDSLFPLLRATADLIERRFPELILEEVEQTHPGALSYRHPALS